MNVRNALIITGILVICFVGGAAARLVVPPKGDAATARAAFLVRELVSELRTDGLVGLDDDEIARFARKNGSKLAEVFATKKARYFEQERKIKALVEENYARDELYKIVADPETAEAIVYACPEYDGQIVPTPLDAAEWPDVFPRGRFGYEARDALKEYIYEEYFEDRGPKGGQASARH